MQSCGHKTLEGKATIKVNKQVAVVKKSHP